MERHIFKPTWQVFVCDLGVRGAFADDYVSLKDCESKTPGQSTVNCAIVFSIFSIRSVSEKNRFMQFAQSMMAKPQKVSLITCMILVKVRYAFESVPTQWFRRSQAKFKLRQELSIWTDEAGRRLAASNRRQWPSLPARE